MGPSHPRRVLAISSPRSVACAPFAALALLGLAAAAPAQTLEELRQQLRDDLRDTHFAQGLAGLVLSTHELELTGARYRIDDEADTEVTVFTLPFHTSVAAWAGHPARLHLEGALGYAEAEQSVDDLFAGTAPGLETSVDTRWRTYGGLLGVGLQWPVGGGVTLTPVLDLSIARLENEADFGGPGAPVLGPLADGIVFNWEAMTFAWGGGGRVDWQRALGERHRLELVARYDVRRTESFDEDDPAQAFASRQQFATLRGDVLGPLGIDAFGYPLGWQLTAAWRQFLEGDLFDVESFAELGAALCLDTGDGLPLAEGFALTATAIVGEDVSGWSFGMRVLF
jgi:hypothetical protein